MIVLRYRQPELPRTFRTPWMPVVPALGIVFSIWLINFLDGRPGHGSPSGSRWGWCSNFAYSYRRSELAGRRPEQGD